MRSRPIGSAVERFTRRTPPIAGYRTERRLRRARDDIRQQRIEHVHGGGEQDALVGATSLPAEDLGGQWARGLPALHAYSLEYTLRSAAVSVN